MPQRVIHCRGNHHRRRLQPEDFGADRMSCRIIGFANSMVVVEVPEEFCIARVIIKGSQENEMQLKAFSAGLPQHVNHPLDDRFVGGCPHEKALLVVATEGLDEVIVSAHLVHGHVQIDRVCMVQAFVEDRIRVPTDVLEVREPGSKDGVTLGVVLIPEARPAYEFFPKVFVQGHARLHPGVYLPVTHTPRSVFEDMPRSR